MTKVTLRHLFLLDRMLMSRFGLAIATATMTSPVVKLWYDKMLAAMNITLSDPRTEAGLDTLVAAGLITAERKAEIVGAMK